MLDKKSGVKMMILGCEGYEYNSNAEWRRHINPSLKRRVHYAYFETIYRIIVDAAVGLYRHSVNYWHDAYIMPLSRMFVAENVVIYSGAEQKCLAVHERKAFLKKHGSYLSEGSYLKGKRRKWLENDL